MDPRVTENESLKEISFGRYCSSNLRDNSRFLECIIISTNEKFSVSGAVYKQHSKNGYKIEQTQPKTPRSALALEKYKAENIKIKYTFLLSTKTRT